MEFKNTFFNKESAILDLIRRYKKNGNIILAIDFDDTIYNWSKDPSKDFSFIHELIREGKKLNFKNVIYTARNERDFNFVKDFCSANNIPIDEINKDVIELKNPTCGKIYYNLLLDDKAGLDQAVQILYELIKRLKNEQ